MRRMGMAALAPQPGTSNKGVGQRQHPGHPADRAQAEVQQRAAAHLAGAADAHHAADAVHVGLAEVVHDVGADRVDLGFEIGDLVARQRGGVGEGHGLVLGGFKVRVRGRSAPR
jgi:hypothetical protein